MIDHCEFTLLGILVTEDKKCIEDAYWKTWEKYKHYENDPDQLKQAFYKRIMAAGAALYKPGTKCKVIIDEHLNALADTVESLWLPPIINAGANQISEKGYEDIITKATDENGPYHLEKVLATRGTDKVLKNFEISIGDVPPLKLPPEPRLIDDFSVVPKKNGLKLSWKRPEQDCDRVVIRRSYEDFPKDSESSDLIFDGNGQEVLDDKVEAGRKCYYSAFSFHQGRISKAKVTREGFFAEPVKNLKTIEHVGKIELCWTPPSAKYERIVLFRSAPNQKPDIEYQDGVPTPKGDTKQFFVNGQNGYIDEGEDIIPGETYNYSVYVDYGFVDYVQFFSEDQSISCSSIPPANPVEKLQITSEKEGLKLTWKKPKNHCDEVKIVRRKDKFPENDTDGDIVYTGKDTEFTNKENVEADKKNVEAGVTYYYSVFSIYRSHASAKVSQKKLYAGDVKDFRIHPHVGFIKLQWKPPTNYEEILLFRGEGQTPKVSSKGGMLSVSDGTQIKLPQKRLAEYDDKEVEPGKQYHYLILVRYADGQYSSGETVTGSAQEPALPVKSILIDVDKLGHVHLKWESPEPKKNYEYVIYRQEDSPITSPVIVKPIDTVNKSTEYVDETAQPGKEYYYAVYSRLGPMDAGRAAQGKIFVTKDVTIQRIVPGNGEVYLEWIPPANVKRIEIVRDGNQLLSATLTCVKDKGLQNDRTYHYRITAVFVNKSGTEIRSKGIEREATPLEPPDILRDMAAKYDGREVTLTWNLPSSPLDEILISRLNAPPKATERESFDVSEIPILKRLPGEKTSYKDNEVISGEVYYYAFYTVKQRIAVFCGYLEVALLEEVKNLKAVNQDGDIILTWDWPPKIDYVKVFRTPVYPDKESKPYTRGQYIYTRKQYISGFIDKVGPNRCKYQYKVHTARKYNGKEVMSPTGACVEVTGGGLPEITYKLNIRPRKKIVEVECDISQVDFPFSGLVLRKKKSARPKNAMDGEEAARWKSNTLKKQSTKVVLIDPNPELDGHTYYRVFLMDKKDDEIVKIKLPPVSRLKA